MCKRGTRVEAILSLAASLWARRSPRGCDGETISIMAERDGDDRESEWEGERAKRADTGGPGRVSRFGGRRGARRNTTKVLSDGRSWRSPHVSRRWRGCESKWSHAMVKRWRRTRRAFLISKTRTSCSSTSRRRRSGNWPRMHAGAGTANIAAGAAALPGATNDTYGWFPDGRPRDHGYLWLLEKFGAQGLQSHAKLVVFDMRGSPRPSAVERVVVAGAALEDGYRGVPLPTPRFPGPRYPVEAACASGSIVVARVPRHSYCKALLSASVKTRNTIMTICRDAYDIGEFRPCSVKTRTTA